MNAFVRDGAVNRKRPARLSLTTRNNEPQTKKIRKTDDDGATPAPRYLASSTVQVHSDESLVNQSKVVATEKESRYSNVEFMRARAFLYLNYKKNSSFSVNKLLKEHLKKFDGNESQLKRIFDQCYDLTGSVEKSKAMMKQLTVDTWTRLDLEIKKLFILPREVVEKPVKILKKTKDKQDEEESCMRITKSYSLRDTKINSFEVTRVTNKPNTNVIIRIKSNLCTNNPQSNKFRAKKSISATTQSKTSIHKKCKKSPNVNDTVNDQMSKSNKNNIEDIIIPQQNTEDFELEMVNNVKKIIVSQLKIHESVQNSNRSVLAQNIDDGETAVPSLIIDEFVENADSNKSDTNIDEENTVLQLKIHERVKNSEDSVLVPNIDDEEMTVTPLIIDEFVENADSNKSDTNIDEENTVLQLKMHERVNNSEDSILIPNIDDDEMTVTPLIIDEFVENTDITESETNIDGENTVLQLKMHKCVNNSEDSILIPNIDDEEMTVTPLIIDEFVENTDITESETNIEGENTVLQLKMHKCVKNSEDSVLVPNIDDEEMTVTPLIIDEFVENTDITESETNIDGENTVLQLKMHKCVNNSEDSILIPNIDDEEMTVTPLIIDEFVENTDITESETNIEGENTVLQLKMHERVKNSEDSVLAPNIDDEEMTVTPLIIDEFVENANGATLETNIFVKQIVDQKSRSTQVLVNSPINALKIDKDFDDSEILNHETIELKIRTMINTDDEVFKISIINDLATYFLNDDFLYKVDALWKTTESELVGELIIKLLNMFNDTEYNMATLTGCLICVFRVIAQKSSYLPCQLKLKLIVFLDAIKKYIKFHDNALWRTWFLPSMFFDWCFIVAFIFMNSKNEFKIDFNKSVIRNATSYYKMVKQCTYIFINQELKPRLSPRKSGIFELTRIDDLLEIDDVHATNDIKIIPNISIDVPSNDLACKKLKMVENCMDTINHTTPVNVEEVCPAPVCPEKRKVIVRPQYNFSNSFINKLTWFNSNVSELMKKFNISTSNESIESSNVQNNITVVNNNILSSSVNKRRCTTNKSTKSKKSKTQIEESPRVFFTIANNPTEFDLTYGSSSNTLKSSSSAVAKNVSSSSAVAKNVSSSSTVPNNSSSSTAIPQSSSLIPQPLSPYYNNFSFSNASSQLPRTSQTVVPPNLSSYYNNITPNITEAPIGLQTRPSISNTVQSSNTKSTNPPVEINITSNVHPYHSSNQHSAVTNSQLPKAATTWPSNKYDNTYSYSSCSKSSTCYTQYKKSAPSYSQPLYNYNISSTTSYPQHSNTLTYPKTYINPLIGDLSARNTARVTSINNYMQQQNYNSNLNILQTHDHNTQVSPDLPDARLPNMPNNRDDVTINKTCMATNCTNTSSFHCNTCLSAFYCSIQCQKSAWYYHQNECCVSF